jgi:outer membrane biosynthesis protein TonB
MPLTTAPTDPEHPRSEPDADTPTPAHPQAASDRDDPLSVVPHAPPAEPTAQPALIRTSRYGELNEYELIHLIDSIEDERARSRFRESIYISLFIWIAIAWVVLYGPRYLWHAPRLVTPFEVLNQRELTQLTNPNIAHHLNTPRPAPKLDNHTLEHLRSEEPLAPRTPPPPSRVPAPAPAPSIPNAAPPVPSPQLPLPSAPQPVARTPPPVVAEAPRPQPNAHPNFNTSDNSANNTIQNAIRNAARNPGGGGGLAASSPGGALGTGVDILSDTQGVDFNPYLRRIIREIYDEWIPLIPEEARPPLSKSGVTMIRFTILPDGRIGAMHLDGSTHDDALNRAAWGSIVGVGQFPPLPSQFHGPNLELRIHYLVNKPQE